MTVQARFANCGTRTFSFLKSMPDRSRFETLYDIESVSPSKGGTSG